jgi:hypothetical protein
LERAGGPVRRLLSSPRRRRRLGRIALVLAVAAGAAALGIWFANTGRPIRNTFSSEPSDLPGPPPKRVPLTAHDRNQACAVAADFIDYAVLRKNSAQAWDLTAPVLRQGLTRRQWSTGAIPVVPFPAAEVGAIKYRVEYSEQDQLWLKVAIVPKPTSGVDGQLFSMGLHRTHSAAHPWLVDYWVPAGVGTPATPKAIARHAPAKPERRVDGRWIFVPIAVLVGLMLCVPLVLAGRGWYRASRANRAYREST